MNSKNYILVVLALFSSALSANNESRSMEFGKHANPLKGKIYSEYNRELKSNSKLSGKVTFNLAIGADGSLEKCSVDVSELKSETLENKICEILKSKSYVGFSVKPSNFTYKLEFLAH